MNPFGLATATEILFGRGIVATELPARVAQMGRRALLVTGSNPERLESATAELRARSLIGESFAVAGEPTTAVASAGVQRARDAGCDTVIAIGGGSAIDAGKAIAALLTNGGEPLDYLEVIGAGKKITEPSAPFAAVPTTAGTGAEVTRNAVLASPEHRVKVSLRSVHMLPRLALLDPELTCSMPPGVTASTGLDALTQVIEPLVSNEANPFTDAVCRDGIQRGARSLARAYTEGDDIDAREDMALVSLFGGLALANAKLGAAHGFAGPLGGMCGGAHGALCAALLPHVMSCNVSALRARAPGSSIIDRYDEIARLLTSRANARAEDGVVWITELCASLSIPGLGSYGLGKEDIDTLVDKASASSSMKGNPIELTRGELVQIVLAAF